VYCRPTFQGNNLVYVAQQPWSGRSGQRTNRGGLMNDVRNKWLYGLAIGLMLAPFSGALHARDPGINQPGVVGGVPGGGAPGVGAWDPGINQPGAMGNVGVAGAGVGAPGRGAWDPGINQPGAMGNVGGGAPGVGVVDPGINQPGAAGNAGVARRSVRR
jgi:hypothetical protein